MYDPIKNPEGANPNRGLNLLLKIFIWMLLIVGAAGAIIGGLGYAFVIGKKLAVPIVIILGLVMLYRWADAHAADDPEGKKPGA